MAAIRFSPSATVTRTEAGVLVHTDLGMLQLEGDDARFFAESMLPLLDGSRDRAGVTEQLEEYSPESVEAFLGVLEQRGLLEEVEEKSADAAVAREAQQREFFRQWSEQPEQVTAALRDARVTIVGLEPWGVTAATALAAAGLASIHLVDDAPVVETDAPELHVGGNDADAGTFRRDALRMMLQNTAPTCIVTADSVHVNPDGLLSVGDRNVDLIIGALPSDELLLLRAMARSAHKTGTRYFSAHLDGLAAVLGPVVAPGETACWNCSRVRLLANSNRYDAERALQSTLLTERPRRRRRTHLNPMAPMLGQLMALEAIKLVSRYTPSGLVGRQLVQNLVTYETKVHSVVRLPWCAVCGGAAAATPASGGPSLPEEVEGEDDEGNLPALDRTRDPTELRERLAGWVDERTGIVRYLFLGTPDATEPDLPVTASAILARYERSHGKDEEAQIASGKGLEPTDAMVGAVGEAIERYSAGIYRRADLLRASASNLDEDFLDPRHLCLYLDHQFDQVEFPFARYVPDKPIEWTRGRWLETGDAVWLPALPVYFNFRAAPDELFCQVTSNGLAAGASEDDAALRATYELIERDAFMLTWLAMRPAQRLLLDESVHLGVREVVRQIQERGGDVELYLLDVGQAIPVVACLAIGDGKNWPGLTVALSAHASPARAVRKAILEQGHVGPYVRRIVRENKHQVPEQPDDVRSLLDHALYYKEPARLEAVEFMRSGVADGIPVADLPEPEDDSLTAVMAQLAGGGIRVAVADVTSPDVRLGPFRVARALGIDVQQIHFGFQKRRLANPRLHAMLTDGLNPHPHPLA